MSRFTPKSAAEWGSVLPTWSGAFGVFLCVIIWAVTPDHLYNPVFVTGFFALLAGGAGVKAIDSLRTPPPPPIPPLDPPAEPEPQPISAVDPQ